MNPGMPSIPTVTVVSAFTPIKNPNIWDTKLNAIMHTPPMAELIVIFKRIPNGFEKTAIKIHPSITPIIIKNKVRFIKTPPCILY